MTITDEQIEQAVKNAYGHYVATARKSGRNPSHPYVPVYRFNRSGTAQTKQIRNRAYKTRDEAIDYAQIHIDALKHSLRTRLREPNKRALREQYGLPREINH